MDSFDKEKKKLIMRIDDTFFYRFNLCNRKDFESLEEIKEPFKLKSYISQDTCMLATPQEKDFLETQLELEKEQIELLHSTYISNLENTFIESPKIFLSHHCNIYDLR